MVHRYLDQYIGAFVVELKDSFYYRANFLASMLFNGGYALVMIFVWTAIFANSSQTQISGFTQLDIYAYFFVFTAFFALSETNINYIIQSSVMDGTIVISRVRPISYIAQVILQALSRTVMLAVTFVLPLFLVGILIGHIPVTAYGLGIAMGIFLIGFTLFSLISFLVGTIAIIITNVRGIMQIVTSLIVIAAGGAIPLIMLPPYLANIAFALPFQTMGYLPTAAIMGIATPSAIANGVIIGCIWVVALFIISFFWWGRVSKKITSVGG